MTTLALHIVSRRHSGDVLSAEAWVMLTQSLLHFQSLPYTS